MDYTKLENDLRTVFNEEQVESLITVFKMIERSILEKHGFKDLKYKDDQTSQSSSEVLGPDEN